jgi:hypothetical protein
MMEEVESKGTVNEIVDRVAERLGGNSGTLDANCRGCTKYNGGAEGNGE